VIIKDFGIFESEMTLPIARHVRCVIADTFRQCSNSS
jgi:hypothetical protein